MHSEKVDVDFILKPSWIIPVVPANKILSDHSIAIKNAKIISVHPSAENDKKFNCPLVITLNNEAVIPGFVNSHTHAAMTLLRGFADDIPLMEWLTRHIWPTEEKFISRQFVYDGSLLACAEMLRSGTTCFNDMYFFPGETGKAAIELGIRACLGITVIEFPTNYASDPQDYLRKGLETRDKMRGEELIKFTLAPHSPYTVKDDTFKKIVMLSDQLQIPIHTHLHETSLELEESRKNYGKRPVARFEELGILGPSFIGAHAVHLDQIEMALLGQQGCSLAHCPASNLKLASGVAQIGQWLQHKINVGIGTDGAASNNSLDMIAEMKLASLLAKGTAKDPEVVPAHKAIEMATLGGAKAVGLEESIGSIEVGKMADLISIDLGQIETQPMYDVASEIVYASGRDKVSNAWVNGVRVLNERKLTKISEESVYKKALLWRNKIGIEGKNA